MLEIIRKICKVFSRNRNSITIKNVTHSPIEVRSYNDSVIIERTLFEITDDWFEKLLSISYDEEIKSKYIPILHQRNEFEKAQLYDICDFSLWKSDHLNKISSCEESINRFKENYINFHQRLRSEAITITDPNHPIPKRTKELHDDLLKIQSDLAKLRALFQIEGYEILLIKSQIENISHPIEYRISYTANSLSEFLDKKPTDSIGDRIAYNMSLDYNQLQYEFSYINEMLSIFRNSTSQKIIAGNAGVGKTHISAHLINRILENHDYIIFFKPKQFNGDNIDLNDKLLQLLQIPNGYTLNEVLAKINQFVQLKNKRCFIIIDALNETTKSSIGFSNIWSNSLQEFINQLGLHSHLYFICTLRTSYINHIWPIKPSSLVEMKGFGENHNIKAACKKYFNYYKIKALNLDASDLSVFRVPLLLDLYCKLINEARIEEKEITLDMNTYLQIFEDYISNLISEVKHKLNLLKDRPIKSGINESSERFLANNEAAITVDEFCDAFDKDDTVSLDKSIARAILEGYLIFIKDYISRNEEVVKHTQQEVGGYLIAKNISDNNSELRDIINNQIFKDKITGTDTTKHHQLRLDILKFLIALRPELITHLEGEHCLRLSWWYLYNGFDFEKGSAIPKYLLLESKNKIIFDHILDVSSANWFNPNHSFNFNFVARLLEGWDNWTFDLTWTFYIYKEANHFYKLIEDNIEKLKEEDNSNIEYYKVVSKFIAYTTATNIRELRDFATIYLIEFGKKYPIELVELTEYTSSLQDIYIYERLTSCCYGVALILQNDAHFVRNILPEMATRLFKLQFSEPAKHPVYNYIVIDSIKHLADLAQHKGVLSLSEQELKNLKDYRFPLPYDWVAPTKQQRRLINQSNEMDWPEPIGMDFGIYTIARIIDDDINKREAISNVYKRIFELGYQTSDETELMDEEFRAFFWGSRVRRINGKVDRLGKKYSWKGLFDFAGVLLLEKKLNIFEKYSGKKSYRRLSDVDIDISIPNIEYKRSIRLYHQDLIVNRENNPEWYNISNVESISSLFEQSFGDGKYIMLHGLIEQRINEEYKTRSYLLAESFFIKKNENFERINQLIPKQSFDWDLGIHFSPERLSKAYFGELYWADNMCESSDDHISIPTGEIITHKKEITTRDLFQSTEYALDDVGKEIEETYQEKLSFESEPTLVEYLWESDSKTLQGHSEYYPSIKMGKTLGLNAEPKKGEILDTNLKECFQCIDFKDKFFENTFNYMREDLIRKYMNDNNLALLYQIKQHSYDDDYRHYRVMKFFILE